MLTLASAYLARHGEAKEHGSEINGPCPWCGGTDRFIIWTEKREGTGKTCQQHNIPGTFWCRQCQKGGDAIAYLMEAEGMDFDEACAELGIPGAGAADRAPRRPAPTALETAAARATRRARSFAGSKSVSTTPEWRAHATRMALACVENLSGSRAPFYVYPPDHPRAAQALDAAEWLSIRHGITPGMARRYGIGFLPGEGGLFAFRALRSFGLEPYANKQGRTVYNMAIPRGVTIPTFDAAGNAIMLRIRRPDPDVRADRRGKYHEVRGGMRNLCHRLDPVPGAAVKAYMIVEGELDAILIHAVSGGGIGAVALRNASNKPDAATHAALKASDLILVCLDNDGAGRRASPWWLAQYPQAESCPPPSGYKDPGDAQEAGIDLRAWLLSALPRSVRLLPPITGDPAQQPAPHDGSVDRHADTQGDGEAPAEQPTPRPTQTQSGAHASAAPAQVPADVLELARIWQRLPGVRYEHDGSGFTWRATAAAHRQPEYWQLIKFWGAHVDAKIWLAEHPAPVVTAANVLDPREEAWA